MEKKQFVEILVGVHSVGKSTWLKTQYPNIVIQPNPDQRVMEKELKIALQSGVERIVYNSTNLKRRYRANLYRAIQQWSENPVVETICFLRPLERILKQNKNRSVSERVDEDLILKQYKDLEVPRIGVDCNNIRVIGEFCNFAREMVDGIHSPHYSPYHLETINEHIDLAISYAPTDQLKEIAQFHDLGKPICQVDDDGDDLGSGFIRDSLGRFCRYTGHEKVSAMYYLAYMKQKRWLERPEKHQNLEVIFQHMKAHQGISEKSAQRDQLTKEDLDLIETFRQVDSRSKVRDENFLNEYQKLKGKTPETTVL